MVLLMQNHLNKIGMCSLESEYSKNTEGNTWQIKKSSQKEDSENDLVCDVLELRDLSIGYDDVLISKINAKVEPGETIAILGPSGIGNNSSA